MLFGSYLSVGFSEHMFHRSLRISVSLEHSQYIIFPPFMAITPRLVANDALKPKGTSRWDSAESVPAKAKMTHVAISDKVPPPRLSASSPSKEEDSASRKLAKALGVT